MTSLLSSISGSFSKSLIVGALLPCALFVLLGQIVLAPFLPPDWAILNPLNILDGEWQLIAPLLLIIVLSSLLYNLNVPIIRFYEGYPWKNTAIGRRRTDHYKAERGALDARWKGMRTLLRAMGAADPRYPIVLAEWRVVVFKLKYQFPQIGSLVLPTRLGNVIRNFEDYPYQQYGIEAVTLWPRLIAKVDKSYAAMIDDAKAPFDFLLNSSLLSAILAFMLLIVGLYYAPPLDTPWLWVPWLLEVLGLASLSYVFYSFSIGRAGDWGGLIKSAFDLYRWDLLKQLGYMRMPTTMREERLLWDEISQQMIYGDTPSTPLIDYSSASSRAVPSARPGAMGLFELEITRGVNTAGQGGEIVVTLRVKNVDPRRRIARQVEIVDRLPDGFDYAWGSARLLDDARGIEVSGTNPYTFCIGDLKFGEVITLIYQAIPFKA